MKTISREALFADAWTRPLSRIAAEFGVSDTALRKMCDRHDIPTPGRGYWAQVASGQTFPHPQLRPAKGQHLETVRIVGAQQPPPEVRAVVAAAKAQAAEQAAAVSAPTTKEPPTEASAGELHPLIRRTQAKLEAAGAKSQDLVQIAGKGLFAVTASPSQAERVGRLISLLLGAMDARGWKTEDSDKGIGLLPEGEPISFELVEQTIRRPHRITEAEQAALDKYEAAQARAARSGRWTYIERPTQPQWDYEPTGQVVLTLSEGRWLDGMRRKFSDGKTQRLEQLIDAIMESLTIYAASQKASRERAEQQRLAAIEAQAKREEEQRRQLLEDKRLEFLRHQMQRHRRALEVEAFIADTEAAGVTDGVVAEFLTWSKAYAADLRADISPEALREKLERLDQMNDAATISGSTRVDYALDPAPEPARHTYDYSPPAGQQYPFWLKHRR
jgi:hypothetical protein